MTRQELRSSLSLAFVFALRMLGLFLVLPVFMLSAADYQGGGNPVMVGMAMGAYGLTQAIMQWPVGWASDRWGRKRVILAGLLLFAVGSVTAALADSVAGLIAGRAIQGAGAVSAAVTALLADQTRDAVRTKAMALIGISIGVTFALALVMGPALAGWIGLSGLFWLTLALTLAGMAVVAWVVPPEGQGPAQQAEFSASRIAPVAPLGQTPQYALLARLWLGVFSLHVIQMAMWAVVPGMLLAAGVEQATHWHVYLPALALSALFLGVILRWERKGRAAQAVRTSISLVLLAQIAFWALAASDQVGGALALGLLLLVFFCGFNAMESILPSQVSRVAAAHQRGAALGAYNTFQSLGLFAGGALGGLLLKFASPPWLFATTAALAAWWLALAWQAPQDSQQRRQV